MTKNLPSISTSSVPVVHAKDGRVYADSRDVAAYFGKLHKDVLKAIDNLDCSEEFRGRNFALTLEIKEIGIASREIRSFNMTRDGFTFLVMGFRGKEAGQFKEAYIAAFNEMEERLRNVAKLAPLPNFSNPSEAARAWAEFSAYYPLALQSTGETRQAKTMGCNPRTSEATRTGESIGRMKTLLHTFRCIDSMASINPKECLYVTFTFIVRYPPSISLMLLSRLHVSDLFIFSGSLL